MVPFNVVAKRIFEIGSLIRNRGLWLGCGSVVKAPPTHKLGHWSSDPRQSKVWQHASAIPKLLHVRQRQKYTVKLSGQLARLMEH